MLISRKYNVVQAALSLCAPWACLTVLGVVLLGLGAISSPASADDELPVPRFVSLKSNEVNMRTGPGTKHPIRWVYRRKQMPIEITAEFNNWRKVRDFDGEEGWILRNLLSGKRTAIVRGDAVAYSFYEGDRAVMRLARRVQVDIEECRIRQCEVIAGDIKGWVDKAKLWGVYRSEEFD